MIQYFVAYGITTAAFFTIDIIWLMFVARRLYTESLGHLLLEKPHLEAAAAFYLVYVIGIIVFAVMPALRADSAVTALAFGALFGFCAYATYDVTNYATLRNWPLTLSIIDTLWGASITAVSAAIGYLGTRLVTG